MFEQIKQVGMTYVTQRRMWYLSALVGLMVLPNLLFITNRHGSTSDAAHNAMFNFGMPMLFVLPFLVGQAKMQFAHSRARLTPQFFPAHLAVLAGILLTGLLLYPFGLAALSGVEPWGVLALGIAIGAPTILVVHFNRFSTLLVSLGVFYSLLSDWGLRWWAIEAAEHRGIHAVIFATGAALIAAWLWRLCHMQEEADDYLNPYQAVMARRTGSEAVEQRRVVAAQVSRNRPSAWISDWWHDQLGGYYGGSKAGLARVLRYGFAVNPIEIQGLMFAAMVVCMGIFFSKFSFLANSGPNFGSMFFFTQFAILLPGQMAGELMAQRRARTAFEILLPLSRKDLINGLFAVSARNSVTLWLMMNVALGVVIATTNFEVSSQAIATYLLLSAATMFAAMALGLRFSVWPSRAKRFTALWCSWIVLLPPMIAWGTLREKVGDAPFYLIAVVLIGAGTWLLYAARKAWLNLELA